MLCRFDPSDQFPGSQKRVKKEENDINLCRNKVEPENPNQ